MAAYTIPRATKNKRQKTSRECITVATNCMLLSLFKEKSIQKVKTNTNTGIN
jgi:hypothetical protein